MDLVHIAAVLAALNVRREDGERLDAGETGMFARQLEIVKAKTYDVKYLNLKARQFIPLDSSIPNGAESFVWRSWDWAGMAKILANYADDLPKVDVLGEERTQGIKSLGDSYQYSIQDIRASALSGAQLDVKRASAARRAIENAIEALAAKGNAAAGLPGFLNNANVPLITAAGALVGGWDTAVAADILADLNLIANTIVTSTKHTHIPDTMILPTSRYSRVATLPMSATDSRTVLQVFLQNSPYVRNVDQWHYLDTADAAGTGPRVVCYERSPEVVELCIPQEFEQFPPQPKGLAFDNPWQARIGGVTVYYPLAMLYTDGV
jgi:hypothetical protein